MDVFDKLQVDAYRNTFPYPAAGTKFTEETKAQRKAYYAEEGRLHAQFRADLLETFDVTEHPKAGRCFEIAWSMGHADGHLAVAHRFSEIVELIQD